MALLFLIFYIIILNVLFDGLTLYWFLINKNIKTKILATQIHDLKKIKEYNYRQNRLSILNI